MRSELQSFQRPASGWIAAYVNRYEVNTSYEVIASNDNLSRGKWINVYIKVLFFFVEEMVFV